MSIRAGRPPTAWAFTPPRLPRVGLTDADGNCIFNIHPPGGLGYAEAARVTAGIVQGARALGRSGATLNDTSRAALEGIARSALD